MSVSVGALDKADGARGSRAWALEKTNADQDKSAYLLLFRGWERRGHREIEVADWVPEDENPQNRRRNLVECAHLWQGGRSLRRGVPSEEDGRGRRKGTGRS